MSNIYKGEFQDYEGNVVYPHSQADVIFCTDGETVQSKLNKTENAIGGVTGKTDSLEVDDSNILATSRAVHTVAAKLGGVDLWKDGDGNCGYYGADGSLIPFNRVSTGTFTISSSGSTIQLGYKPKTVLVFNFSSSGPILKLAYHSEDTKLNGLYDFTSQGGTQDSEQAITTTDEGFIITQFSNWITGTCYYFAW